MYDDRKVFPDNGTINGFDLDTCIWVSGITGLPTVNFIDTFIGAFILFFWSSLYNLRDVPGHRRRLKGKYVGQTYSS